MFDAHSDIPTHIALCRQRGEGNILARYHLDRLRQGGFSGACFAFWMDPPYADQPAQRLAQQLRYFQEELAQCPQVQVVRTPEEVAQAKAQGKFYLFLSLEGMSPIGEDLDQIPYLASQGIRSMMLTWNEENALATGAKGNPQRGLQALGRQAIPRMEAEQIILDVSHLNETSFWQALEVASRPVLASHSNAQALAPVPRNLSDRQLLALGDTGGLVCLNAHCNFISTQPAERNLQGLARHASYIADKIGVEHLGFGFDFLEFLEEDAVGTFVTEIPLTQGLEDCSKVPSLLHLLRQEGFSPQDLEKIKEENWLNFLRRWEA